jgi:hypothetical protein
MCPPPGLVDASRHGAVHDLDNAGAGLLRRRYERSLSGGKPPLITWANTQLIISDVGRAGCVVWCGVVAGEAGAGLDAAPDAAPAGDNAVGYCYAPDQCPYTDYDLPRSVNPARYLGGGALLGGPVSHVSFVASAAADFGPNAS